MMLGFNADDMVRVGIIIGTRLRFDIHYAVLNDLQMWLTGNNSLHPACVFGLVALSSCCLNGWTTAGIERLFL